MRIYGWEVLVVCHHRDKSYSHKHCDSGDNVFNLSRNVMFLILVFNDLS